MACGHVGAFWRLGGVLLSHYRWTTVLRRALRELGQVGLFLNVGGLRLFVCE